MLVCLISDIHFSVRNASKIFLDSSEKFFTEVFFPYIDKHKIDTIIICGDLNDNRKFMNFYVLSRMRKFFVAEVVKRKLRVIVTLGNHDVYYKNSNHINSVSELLDHCENFEVQTECNSKILGGKTFSFIPWINSENEKEVMEFIKNDKSDYLCAHLELQNFEMFPGIVNDHGTDHKLFKQYKRVFSGHFHLSSIKDNVRYLGCPYEMNWSDYGVPKGFWVFDTDDENETFVQNPNTTYVKLWYDEEKKISKVTQETIENKFVKLIVINKKDLSKFEDYITSIYMYNPINLTIDEKIVIDNVTGENEANLDIKDTWSVIDGYLNNLKDISYMGELKDLMKSLYLESENDGSYGSEKEE